MRSPVVSPGSLQAEGKARPGLHMAGKAWEGMVAWHKHAARSVQKACAQQKGRKVVLRKVGKAEEGSAVDRAGEETKSSSYSE